MSGPTGGQRAEAMVQVAILVGVAGMAGAASFTHVHDWTMAHSPANTQDWFGWANAVISELIPIMCGLSIRRRRRLELPIWYPMGLLLAAAAFSLAAQVARAEHSPTGWLVAGLPALAFMGLVKLALTETAQPATEPATAGVHPVQAPVVVSAPLTVEPAPVSAHEARPALTAPVVVSAHPDPQPLTEPAVERAEPVKAERPLLTVVAPLVPREQRPARPVRPTPRPEPEQPAATPDALMRKHWDAEVAEGRVPTGAELARIGEVSEATGKRRRVSWEAELPADLRGGDGDVAVSA